MRRSRVVLLDIILEARLQAKVGGGVVSQATPSHPLLPCGEGVACETGGGGGGGGGGVLIYIQPPPSNLCARDVVVVKAVSCGACSVGTCDISFSDRLHPWEHFQGVETLAVLCQLCRDMCEN